MRRLSKVVLGAIKRRPARAFKVTSAVAVGGAATAYYIYKPTLDLHRRFTSPTFLCESKGSTHQFATLSEAIYDADAMDHFEKTFLKYASKQKEDGEKVMTVEDFVRAMLCKTPGCEIQPPDVSEMKYFFKLADTNRDGTIDFAEFVVFSTLINKEEAELRLVFEMFDEDSNGLISKEDFTNVVSSQVDPQTAQSLSNDNFLDHFFKDPRTGEQVKLDFAGFTQVLKEVKKEISKQEFRSMITPIQTTTTTSQSPEEIDIESFRSYIAQHLPSEILFKSTIIQNLQNLRNPNTSKIDFTVFSSTKDVLPKIHQIENVIKLHTIAGGHLDEAKFDKSLKLLFKDDKYSSSLTPEQKKVAFQLFNINSSDSLRKITYSALVANEQKLKAQNPNATHTKQQQQQQQKMSIPQTFLLGGMAAICGATVVFPIDKVKTRVQSSKTNASVVSSVVSTFKEIYKTEGVRGLYRGITPQLVGITPEKALKITVNDFLRRKFQGKHEDRPLSMLEELMAGVGTGCVQVFATNPYEVVKIRMQMQKTSSEQLGLVSIVRSLGLKGLYRGLPATLCRDLPFNAIYFSSYAGFKTLLKDDEGKIGGLRLLAAGCGAGFLGAVLDTPADTIKTRLQSGKYGYKGVVDAARTIWREEGAQAFTKGWLPRVLIVAPLFAITFAVFEKLQRVFAPQSSPPVKLLADEINLVREHRLKQIEGELRDHFGLKVKKN